MPSLFVGCVTRPERFSHRAQITPPRNTPEPKPLPVTNPWCVRGAGFHASSSHAVTTRPYPSASCVTSPRLTHPTGLSNTCTGGKPVPRGILHLFVGCVTRPEHIEHRAQITPPRNTPESRPHAVTNPRCVRGAGFPASPSNAVTTRPYPSASCVTSPRLTHPTGLSSTCTGGTPSLFVGCVTRHEYVSHRAQITPPRNTPEPRPHPVTNPWCVRGAGFHASSSHAVTTRPYPSASCVTSPRLTHPTGLYQHMHGRDDKPLRRVCDAARAILAPRANHSAAEHTRTKAPTRHQPLVCSRGRFPCVILPRRHHASLPFRIVRHLAPAHTPYGSVPAHARAGRQSSS
jgi:hypothetical protein